MKGLARRDFLRMGAAAGLAAGLGSLNSRAESARPLRLGFIGVGGRGTGMLLTSLEIEGLAVTAVCDLEATRVTRAAGLVEKSQGNSPVRFAAGPTDYRNLLKRADVDAVFIATPPQFHAPIAVDALRAGKHTLSEVPAAMTLEECWALVKAGEESGRLYMLAENCCYYPTNLAVLNMVHQGSFGQLTYGDCGYVHDCRTLLFNPDGSMTWRGELTRAIGNWYPTHAIGPVAQWLGINRGDRFVSLVAMESPAWGIASYAEKQLGPNSPGARTKFGGDACLALLRTAEGRVIELRFDVTSPRPAPSTTFASLQGTRASYKDSEAEQRIWIDGRSPGHAWEKFAKYQSEFEHDLWKQWGSQALKTQHGGADFFVFHQFAEAIRAGGPSPIDVYDAATWSVIFPVTTQSVLGGGKPQEMPDFTRGKWQRRAT